MAIDELQIKQKELDSLRQQLKLHNQGVQGGLVEQKDKMAWQRFEQDQNYRSAIEKKMLTNEEELTDLEALMAVRIQIENEIEANQQAITRLQVNSTSHVKDIRNEDLNDTMIPNTINSLKDNMLKKGPVNSSRSKVVPLDKNRNKVFENQDNLLQYRKTAIPKVINVTGGKVINIQHRQPQEYGSNYCWAITMQNMFAAAGIHMDYHEILKYIPKTTEEDPQYGVSENQLLSILADPEGVQSIHDMRGLFHEILGDRYELEELSEVILHGTREQDYKSKNGSQASQKDRQRQNIVRFIRKSIDAGAPVSCIFGGHYITIRGYSVKSGDRMVLDVINSSGGDDGHCNETMEMDAFMDRLWESRQVDLSSLRKKG